MLPMFNEHGRYVNVFAYIVKHYLHIGTSRTAILKVFLSRATLGCFQNSLGTQFKKYIDEGFFESWRMLDTVEYNGMIFS